MTRHHTGYVKRRYSPDVKEWSEVMPSVYRNKRELSRIGRTFRRLIEVAGWVATVAMPIPTAAQILTVPAQQRAYPNVIVVGFLGGFVRNDDDRHPEVQIVQRLSEEGGPEFHAVAFENRRRARAREEILRWLDTDENGHLSAQEKANARIILFGDSWGGSAAIKLARDLDRRGIRVLLTIQVDSINKGWGRDCVIPDNVAQAVNFYQTSGVVHGCRTIRAADPQRTRIIGNRRFEYSVQPARCRSYSWFNRHFFKTHNAIGCDPVVWAQVADEIHTHLQSSIRLQEAERMQPFATGLLAGKQ